jgi:hypothetical protein
VRRQIPSGGLRARLTYANVISTVCLFLLVGGGSAYAGGVLAPGSVGTQQLKSGAVTAAKVKGGALTGAQVRDHSLTGADLDLTKLGTVPSAADAERAGSAASAATAQSALHADSAGHADAATQAGDAELLGGAPPSAYKPGCPAGTGAAPGNLCVSNAAVTKTEWGNSLEACAARGLALPSPAEAFLISSTLPTGAKIWTQALYKEGATFKALYFRPDIGGVSESATNAVFEVFCVTTPGDG